MDMIKRYQNVEKLMPYNAKKLALNLNPHPKFSGDTVTYSQQYYSSKQLKERMVTVNLLTGKKSVKMPKAPTVEPYHPETSLSLTTSDGRYSIYNSSYNLFVKDNKTKKETQITTDGNEYYAYGENGFPTGFAVYKKRNKRLSALISPDQKYAIIPVMIARNIGTVTLTQVFNDQSTTEPMHPRDLVYHDWFPFEKDAYIAIKLALLNIADKSLKLLDHPDFYQDPCRPCSSYCKWEKDSKGFVFVESDPCVKFKNLFYVSVDDLKPVKLYHEETKTFFDDFSINGLAYGSFGFPIHLLKDHKKAIVISYPVDNRSLYLYDCTSFSFEKKLTNDDVYVSNLLHIDEENQIIYFTGSGLKDFSDPYYCALCSVKFDGSDFKVWTKEDAHHKPVVSDNGKYYADTYSTIDSAPITVIKDFAGKINEITIHSDISKLLKAGYIFPKTTKVTLDDGTELYGCIVLPDNYNENKKYPVVDYCYGGPQKINTPKSFECYGEIPGREGLGGLEGFAKLGFIGVIIDGRGTPHRGKKMHDLSYQNLQGCDGLADHVEFLQKLAQQYKGIDLNNVGIWGNSAGGYASTRALLLFPDFYKVAVSSAGDHDNTTYNSTWGNIYQGDYDKDIYLAQDSAQLVNNLKGHLMLVHGLLDDNVHPSQTLRMIQYFNKANKDVDLLLLPDTDHNCPGNVYFMRRRFDYFVRYLMHKEPPKEFHFSGQD